MSAIQRIASLSLFLTCLCIANPALAQDVLIIWDVNNADTQALATAMTNAGLSVTLSNTSETAYDGTNPSYAHNWWIGYLK